MKESRWVPLGQETTRLDSAEIEVLVFDRVIAITPARPEAIVSIYPVRRVTRIVEEVVNYREGPAARYTTAPVASLMIDTERPLGISARPAADRLDMLVVSTTTPLPSGYYLIEVRGGHRHMVEVATALPSLGELHAWYRTLERSEAFSWGQWQVDADQAHTGQGQRNYQGRSILNIAYKEPEQYEQLASRLWNQVNDALSTRNVANLVALIPQVTQFDSSMNTRLRDELAGHIYEAMQTAYSQGNTTGVVGLYEGAQALMSDHRDMKTLYASARTQRLSRESRLKEKYDALLKDADARGNLLTRYSLRESDGITEANITIAENHLHYTYKRWGFAQTNNVWYGDIASIKTYDSMVFMTQSHGASLDLARHGAMDSRYVNLLFGKQTERDQFVRDLDRHRRTWEEKWADALTVEITAWPVYWSEAVYVENLPWRFDSMEDDRNKIFEVQSDDRHAAKVEPGKTVRLQASWLRFRSLDGEPVRVVVRRCMYSGMKRVE